MHICVLVCVSISTYLGVGAHGFMCMAGTPNSPFPVAHTQVLSFSGSQQGFRDVLIGTFPCPWVRVLTRAFCSVLGSSSPSTLDSPTIKRRR